MWHCASCCGSACLPAPKPHKPKVRLFQPLHNKPTCSPRRSSARGTAGTRSSRVWRGLCLGEQWWGFGFRFGFSARVEPAGWSWLGNRCKTQQCTCFATTCHASLHRCRTRTAAPRQSLPNRLLILLDPYLPHSAHLAGRRTGTGHARAPPHWPTCDSARGTAACMTHDKFA